MLALTFDSMSQTTSNQCVEYENPHRKMKEKFSTWAVIHSFRIYDLYVFLNVIAVLPCMYTPTAILVLNKYTLHSKDESGVRITNCKSDFK